MTPTPGAGRSPDFSFATTRWSVVLAAGEPSADPARQAALADLCQDYWAPIYGYIRRRSQSVETAQDLTQAFFLTLLEKDAIAAASPDRGRFRAFLLTCAKNFVTNERARGAAEKRGGGKVLSLDWTAAESRLSFEPADELTPERLFERDWALTLLDQVLDRLKAECAADGKAREFDALKAVLSAAPPAGGYEAVASELNCTAAAARQTARRLKLRYRKLLREEVARTVADPSDVDDEIRRLFETFSR
jgi:RNA polymerase sigma-70 factor (ECF subfamily)